MGVEINQAALADIQRKVELEFNDELATFDQSRFLITKIATEINSGGAGEILYPITRSVPRLKSADGTLKSEDANIAYQRVIAEPYQNGFGIPRQDIERDAFGLYVGLIREFAARALYHPEELLVTTIAKGITLQGYDKVPFFGSNHPGGNKNGNGTRSNLIDGGPESDRSLTPANLRTALQKLARQKDFNGNPLGYKATHLIVPTVLELDAKRIVSETTAMYAKLSTVTGANIGSAGASETSPELRSIVEVASSPYLDDALLDIGAPWQYSWMLIDASGSKPFLFQKEVPLQVTSSTNPEDYSMMYENRMLHKIYARYSTGYGRWEKALLVKSNLLPS